MIKKLLFSILLINNFCAFSQKKIEISIDEIPEKFIKNSNRVVVDRIENNEIVSQTTIKLQFSEINFIKNEEGLKAIDKSIVYDKLSKLKKIEFKIYNAQGELVKIFKEKDFADTSLADGFSILTDDRMKYLEPKYFQYPYFTKFDYELEKENTIFIPAFFPFQSPDDKVMNASYELNFPAGYTINRNEKKIAEFNIVSSINPQKITYKITNAEAPVYEEMNYKYMDLLPMVRFSNNTFGLGNVKGTANNWNEFGTWYHQNFLKGLDELPKATVLKMQELTKNATSDIEKAQIIFDYVQNNTRYISIQVGLGGWRPFAAKEVDRLGYGDCKALTNYTKSLLTAVGVTSYYTIIHASDKIIDIDEKTIALQGNHVILTIPTANGNVFLECTNQKVPFGFLGMSTINRKALVVKEDGAFFVSTYSNNENQNVLKGNFIVDLTNMQKVQSKISFVNHGVFYQNVFFLNTKDQKEVSKYLKDTFSELKNLKIVDYQNSNDNQKSLIKEEIVLESDFIGSKMGNDYMLAANGMFKVVENPKKYPLRKTGFNIAKGKTYHLTTEYLLPKDVKIEFKPENKTIESVFGKHSLAILTEANKIVVKEEFVLKAGDYTKEQYSLYEKFIDDVIQSNYAKFILSKI